MEPQQGLATQAADGFAARTARLDQAGREFKHWQLRQLSVFSDRKVVILTTIAAFMPLMLLPGIMGKFMRVIPFVVSLALLASGLPFYLYFRRARRRTAG